MPLLALWLLAALAGAKAPLPVVPPVQLSAAWTTVALPAEPLGIVAQEGTFWVVGEDEMIADSTDGGRHWTVLNLRHGGEMLFTIAFPRPGQIEAFGSGGVRIESTDGGKTWRNQHFLPPIGLSQVVLFATGAGFAIGGRYLGITRDGGKTWRFKHVNAAHSDQVGEMEQMAVRDQDHAAILVSARRGPKEAATVLVSTSNGGDTWNIASLQDEWAWNSVRVSPEGYDIFGDQLKGSTVTPATAHSRDGLHWTLRNPPPTTLTDCGPEGCLVNDGWVDLRGDSPRYWQLPNDMLQPLTASWATGGDVFCRVSSELRCRIGNEKWQMPAPLPGEGHVSPHKCVSCQPPAYPIEARSSRLQGAVVLLIYVDRTGHVLQAIPRAASSMLLANAAVRGVRGWVYSPGGGAYGEAITTVQIYFTLGR